jgi:hypothetical protein
VQAAKIRARRGDATPFVLPITKHLASIHASVQANLITVVMADTGSGEAPTHTHTRTRTHTHTGM